MKGGFVDLTKGDFIDTTKGGFDYTKLIYKKPSKSPKEKRVRETSL